MSRENISFKDVDKIVMKDMCLRFGLKKVYIPSDDW